WLPYAELAIAMLVGREVGVAKADHRNYQDRLRNLEAVAEAAFLRAVDLIDLALLLDGVHVGTATLQRLSAVFRRGDLLGGRAIEEKVEGVRAQHAWVHDVMRLFREAVDAVENAPGDADGAATASAHVSALRRALDAAPSGARPGDDENFVGSMMGMHPSFGAWILPLWDRVASSRLPP
ncbi:MAG: hypothetical protein KC583_08580, partial [Myxococcales bacterium]|nr:hypothetical protein [Myxococcales bacterium]